MSEQHGSYYVPAHSALPIIGAIGLLFFAIGSLNTDSSWGPISLGIGLIILVGMLFFWFRAMISESRQGLYDKQMDRTFRWGMFWFLFTDFTLFGTILGALVYTRWASLPWLAGKSGGGSLLTHYVLWPNFQNIWPLIKNPAPYLFSGLHLTPSAWGIPAINSLLMIISSAAVIIALLASRKGNRWIPATGLLIAIFLGIVFIVLQTHYLLHETVTYGLTVNSGIYGSLFFMLIGVHTAHIAIGILILAIMLVRLTAGHFATGNYFGLEAAVSFWVFLSVVWLLIFVFLYGF